MANLNEAYKLQYNGRPVNLPELKPPTNEEYGSKYASYNGSAFARVKTSNPKYDNMVNRYNKNPTFGYECTKCHKSVGYHMKIQDKYPHDFVKGEFRKLEMEEIS